MVCRRITICVLLILLLLTSACSQGGLFAPAVPTPIPVVRTSGAVVAEGRVLPRAPVSA